MKTLIILRHGKADSYDAKPNDYDRALVDRGRRNAVEMGQFIMKKFGVPELILSSGARRAAETAILVGKELKYPVEKILLKEDLYLASVRKIYKVIIGIPDENLSCLLVGHNPGLTDLVNEMGIRLDNLPTCSAVCFSFDTDCWNEVSAKNAHLLWFQQSKEL
ncbi:MAG: SixA phosphatase family protein [Paludibacteraceae bacterium]